jgi:taurine dioxygenase
VRGIDLSRDVDDTVAKTIYRTWLQHCVLLFRDQELTHADQVAFSRRFGDLDIAPVDEYGRKYVDGHPELLVISNVVEDGRPIGSLGAGEANWHTDMSYNEEPPRGSALYAVEVPRSGGNTGFLNMYKAYETLPEHLRERVAGLKIKHDASYNSVGLLREGLEETSDVVSCPGAVHPIVRTHPEARRKALFLGRRRNAYIMDLPVEESEALLDELWEHVTQRKFCWHHEWRVGDLLIWDNRCAMHRRDAFDSGSRRLMYRTQIKGDRPF